jgi:hypothetical protein
MRPRTPAGSPLVRGRSRPGVHLRQPRTGNGNAELVRWGRALDEAADGSSVTESWEALPAYPDFVPADEPDADVALA